MGQTKNSPEVDKVTTDVNKVEQDIKLLKYFLGQDPIPWNELLSLYVNNIFEYCSFEWILSKRPTSSTIKLLLNKYQSQLRALHTEKLKTYLYIACKYSSLEVVTYFINHHAHLIKYPLDNVGNLALHLAQTDDIADLLLKSYPEAIFIRNKMGNIPLHVAINSYRHPNHVNLLVENGIILNQVAVSDKCGGILAENNRGETPFSLICHQVVTGIDMKCLSLPLYPCDLRLWENLKMLLKSLSYFMGKETKTVDTEELNPCRVLHSAISLGCPQQVVYLAYLLMTKEVQEADENGRYPLSLIAGAVTYEKRLLTSMLKTFPEAVGIADNRGRLPLHWASESGRRFEDGLEDLFLAEPSILIIPDNEGMYPFMLASTNASLDTIYRLLRECPHLLQNH